MSARTHQTTGGGTNEWYAQSKGPISLVRAGVIDAIPYVRITLLVGFVYGLGTDLAKLTTFSTSHRLG